MAQLFSQSGPWVAAATAEGLTAAQAKAARNAVVGDLRSIILWAQDPAQAGVDEAGMKAGWPQLEPLSDAQVRMIMRVIADFTDGLFVP